MNILQLLLIVITVTRCATDKLVCSVWITMSLKCVDGLLGLGDYYFQLTCDAIKAQCLGEAMETWKNSPIAKM